MKKQKGITLIALVITIVVLIILATVSINAVVGENGLIRKAEQAKELYNNSTISEEEAMNTLAEQYDNATTGTPPPVAGTLLSEKPSTWTSTQVTAIADGNGGVVPLPSDFYYIGGDYNTGLVISDKQTDTLNSSGISMGNQFVWIPVTSEADLTRTDTACTEPYTDGYSTEVSEYNTMKTQVLKYGGFYIGRYEAGINSNTLRTTYSTAQTVVSKKGVAPYNYVPWGAGMSNASEVSGKSGAVYLATNFDTQEGWTSVTSTLCYGCQWDAMCRYIGDSNRTTPTKDAPELTGSVSTDVSKNIYDLAGNCREWTMEAQPNYEERVFRGGSYCSVWELEYRQSDGATSLGYDYQGDYGFRCTLYIK